jgi:ATP-dependent DNA ligase
MCKLCHKEFEGTYKVKFMPIDIKDSPLSYSQRQVLLKQLVTEISNEAVTPLVKFKDFESGWNYVKETKGEGLVVRNEREWFKVKALQNTKIEIVRHEEGSEKGCFILSNGNKVSGTSKELVKQFKEIKERGNKAIAEISYPFITETGHFFQPRLTNLCEVENEKLYSL